MPNVNIATHQQYGSPKNCSNKWCQFHTVSIMHSSVGEKKKRKKPYSHALHHRQCVRSACPQSKM